MGADATGNAVRIKYAANPRLEMPLTNQGHKDKSHFKVVLRGELGSTSPQQRGKLAHFCILLSSHIAFDTSLTSLKLCHYPSTVYDSLITIDILL